MKLVTVIVPSFNHARFLDATLESLISQTYKNLELVLIDDGSTDGSAARISALRDKLVARFTRTHIVVRANKGLTRTLNEAILAARGEFLLYFASDDVALPGLVSALMTRAELEGDDCLVVSPDADFIDDEGRQVFVARDLTTRLTNGPHTSSRFVEHYTRARPELRDLRAFGSYETLLGGNYLPPGVLVRRDVLLDAGLYQPDRALEDAPMWLKLSKLGRIVLVPEVLEHYRVHGTNTVRRRHDRLRREYLSVVGLEREYCERTGRLEVWRQMMAALVDPRSLEDLLFALSFGVSPTSVLRSKIRLAAEYGRSLFRA